MFHQSPEFKSQQREWYEILKDSGFEDIEVIQSDGREVLKKAGEYRYYKNGKRCKRRNDAEYFLLLSQFVENEIFHSKIDEFIMHACADGWLISEICVALNRLGPPYLRRKNKRHRKTVMFIKRKYEHKWGIRYWKPQELTSNRPLRKSRKQQSA
jgi:hypothetical protein